MDNIQTFSVRSGDYARHRPTYPRELFQYLNRLVGRHERAWDCATGNGQAALGLAEFFDHVAATDISPEQIRQRLPHPRVTYGICSAERAPFRSSSLDLIAVAQALHWFDTEQFFIDARRVLKPGGVLAAWGYSTMEIEPELDAAIAEHLLGPVAPFWSAGNRLVSAGYQTLVFPLEQVAGLPSFAVQVEWTLPQLLDYLLTWSAVKRYAVEYGDDPVSGLEAGLKTIWGKPEEVKRVRMPLHLRVGRKIA